LREVEGGPVDCVDAAGAGSQHIARTSQRIYPPMDVPLPQATAWASGLPLAAGGTTGVWDWP
jgi:hypothetical protein